MLYKSINTKRYMTNSFMPKSKVAVLNIFMRATWKRTKS